ncbi:MAG: FumA C-terminus/TtdB family hydratase beta subunit [Promethearchaeota archaeon]
MNYNFILPIQDDDIKKLKIGDVGFLNGVLIMAIDQAHKRIVEHIKKKKFLPESFNQLRGIVIYHCGPIVKGYEKKFEIISAGPTTSQRIDYFENDVIKHLGIKLIIGKGGMKNLNMRGNFVLYSNFTGGYGAIVNQKIDEVIHFDWKDLGLCEAVWFLKVKDFGPLIVAQDTNEDNLYKT